eukprot:CAMPEP_0197634252 /NCGR_PEP_ID=MMETSP1338-20131121/10395_1 /TAXON_ID=43686 ORGANISM="Pelagodinium beii, Strain RCC1491" /NCGR_SAMPLE_ID=MMETSP1338 /ASSEMBLY_ACC=CAM_ASM_000754 /LENGTH=365 /DNA_ID=CAMNT_0043206077 /DNA_START=14 /DNA_END=1108 /DNA_ORIENTATION=+
MMDSQVPYRCLVPADAVSFIIGKGGANIRQISDNSGANVSISKDGDTPSTLADKIVTIGGVTTDSKQRACAEVVRKLRQMQGVTDMEPGVFVIIIPQISAPVIIGAKGAQIKSIMEQSGAEINVGRESIIGMPDQPISINGTLDQVVSAVSKLNTVLQDMVDRGKLTERDFQFRGDNYSPEEAKPSLGDRFNESSGCGGSFGRSGGLGSAPEPAKPSSFGGSGLNGAETAPARSLGAGGGFSAQEPLKPSFGSGAEQPKPTSFGGGYGSEPSKPTSFGNEAAKPNAQTSFGGSACNGSSFGGTSFGGCGGSDSAFGPGNSGGGSMGSAMGCGGGMSFGSNGNPASSFGSTGSTSFGGMGGMGGMG